MRAGLSHDEAMKTTILSDKDWKTLVSHLPEGFEELAHQHRVLNTQWPNAKVTDAETLLRFILLHVGADLALRQTVTLIAEAGGPDVTQVWLHKRMRCAQPYLAALVQRMVSDVERDAVPERWAGYEMVCLDGSTVSGPGSDGADVRMHGVLRLHDLRVCDILVTGVVEGETLQHFMWEPNQLVIVDRGYANPPGIMWTVERESDVLVRVNRGALPLYDKAEMEAANKRRESGEEAPRVSGKVKPPKVEPIDVLGWCRGIRGHDPVERAVMIEHGTKRKRRELEGRLIGMHLPPKQAREARARVRREDGPSVTEEHLEAAEYVVLFTTAPVRRLSATRCVEAYRLRWQIELQWKRWKSICHFDRLPNYRDDTMVSWLTAKVLLGLLTDRVASATAGASDTKRPMARQPWKLTSIVWPLIVAALMPIRLANAAEHMPVIADRLDDLDDLRDTRQTQVFRTEQFAISGKRAALK